MDEARARQATSPGHWPPPLAQDPAHFAHVPPPAPLAGPTDGADGPEQVIGMGPVRPGAQALLRLHGQHGQCQEDGQIVFHRQGRARPGGQRFAHASTDTFEGWPMYAFDPRVGPGAAVAQADLGQPLQPAPAQLQQQQLQQLQQQQQQQQQLQQQQQQQQSSAGGHVTGAFQNEIFSSRYQRNNKRGGLKNLRCFPSCGFRHKERGFCGRSVEIEINHPPQPPRTSNYYAWVEFVKRDEPPPFRAGQVVSLQSLTARERTKEDPTKALVRGDLVKEKCTETVSAFEFNKERRGWHYGWNSNKHTCDAEHALRCYVFRAEPGREGLVRWELTVQSPSFTLFCRRRRRFTLAPSAPIAVPHKRSHAEMSEAAEAAESQQVKRERDNTGDDGAATCTPAVRARTNGGSGGGGGGGGGGSSECPLGDVLAETPTVLVSPVQRGPMLSGSERTRMEDVMRRLAVIVARIQQLQQQEHASQPGGSGPCSAPEDQGPEDLQLDMDFGRIFQMMPEWPDEGGGETGSSRGGRGAFDDTFREEGDGVAADLWLTSLESSGLAPEPEPAAEVAPAVPTPKPLGRSMSEQMLDDVANYLRKESGFARAVDQLTRQAKNGTPNYLGFLEIVKEHLDSYRRSRNISLLEFNRFFAKVTGRSKPDSGEPAPSSVAAEGPSPPAAQGSTAPAASSASAPPREPRRSILTSALGAITSLVSSSSSSSSSSGSGAARAADKDVAAQQRAAFLPVGGGRVPNLQGSWQQTPESEAAMQEMRHKMGTPWILSKMFEFMESRFEIEQRGLDLITRLNRAWISNTTLKMTLDGELHHWGISLPPPFSQLSQGWTYRAWSEDNRVVLCHMIGEQRLTRVYWVSRDRATLHSMVILEEQDGATGAYSELGRVSQHARRVA